MSTIEKRRHRRINYTVNADITCANTHYNGVIVNFSETGVFKIVFSEKSVIDFFPGGIVMVNFIVPSGNELNLECMIKWVCIEKGSPIFLKYHMGLKIIKNQPMYEEFMKTLQEKSTVEMTIT
jgi:hypothetical protein